MPCRSVPVGFGTNVAISLLGPGCVAPELVEGIDPSHTITVASGGVVAKGSNSIPITAIPAGITIIEGSYLAFTDPAGTQTLVRLSALAVPGDVTLTVEPTPAAIEDLATAKFVVPFGGRVTAGVDISGDTLTSTPFDESGFQTVNTSTQSASITLDGNFLETDPGTWTAFRSLIDKIPAFVVITRPIPQGDTRYLRGTRWSGETTITATPVDIPSDGIVTMNVAASFSGAPTISEPLPTP